MRPEIASPNAIFSPARIEVLLHCHCIPEPVPHLSDLDEPGHEMAYETIKWLIDLDAVEPHETETNRYVTTERGRAWVEALCRVEAPRATYVDRDGTVLL